MLTSADQFRPHPPTRTNHVHQSAAQREFIRTSDQALLTHPWTEILLKKIVQYDLSPVRAARAIALVHVAMSDALAACWDAKYAYDLPSPVQVHSSPIPSFPSEHATVAAAASTVLSYLFPVDTSTFRRLAREAGESRIADGANLKEDVEAGRVLGARVGAEVVRRGKEDGSDQSYRLTIPQGPGYWKPPLVGMAADPTGGSWRPWVLASGAEGALPPPPAPGSPEYQADIDEMVAVAGALTDEQQAIARYWSDGPGTITPAGHWIQIAEQHVAREFAHDPPRAAYALALVSMAMADAFIACWDAKYTYWTARPNQVIAGFTSYIKTPPFPGYPSGHSTQSAAAAEVLAFLIPDRAAEFRAMAEESAISRLYGGIHFSSDNRNGLALGRDVGRRVVDYAQRMERVSANEDVGVVR
ncbi:MAG: phosphatase PAP2 family protein [Nitrospirota bacterium]